MNLPTRKVEFTKAVDGKKPLIVGITGPSGSGKTYSGLRLAVGMQRVVGGDIFVIDTEARRATHYAQYFNFQHYDFKAPHGPLDYVVAINAAVSAGAKIILIDSMSHEHEGEGGVLDQIEKQLDEWYGSDWQKRQANMMRANARPKAQRKSLNLRIKALGEIIFILCYRAQDKVKPRKKGAAVPEGEEKGMLHLGWQPITTSDLIYEMACSFLLLPGCDGKPTFKPETAAEKLLSKNAEQFRGWFVDGVQLNEDLGVKLATWAQGTGKSVGAPTVLPPSAPAPAQTQPSQAPPKAAAPAAERAPLPPDGLSAIAKACETKLKKAGDMAELTKAFKEFNENKSAFTSAESYYLIGVKDARKEELGSPL